MGPHPKPAHKFLFTSEKILRMLNWGTSKDWHIWIHFAI